MKVLFLATWFPYPLDNGSKIRAYYLVRALAERHEVTLVSFAFGTAQPDQPQGLSELCRAIHTVKMNLFEVNQSTPIGRFASLSPVVTRPVPAMQSLVREVTSGGSFAAVIASTQAMAIYAVQSLEIRCRILEEHNSLSRWMAERLRAARNPIERVRSWLSWRKARLYEARLFAQFDLITMVSKQDWAASRALIADRPERVKLVPNGVDVHWNRPSPRQSLATGLVYNGSLTYQANLEAVDFFLAEIYPTIKEKVPEVSLSITGSIEKVETGRYAEDSSIILTGNVPDVRPIVSGAGAVVAPILSGGGTRLKILEAMALGTPVVATSRAAEGLDVTDGGDILMADDPAVFANRTVQVLNDRALARTIARNARQLVEDRYDWERIGRDFACLVERAATR